MAEEIINAEVYFDNFDHSKINSSIFTKQVINRTLNNISS